MLDLLASVWESLNGITQQKIIFLKDIYDKEKDRADVAEQNLKDYMREKNYEIEDLRKMVVEKEKLISILTSKNMEQESQISQSNTEIKTIKKRESQHNERLEQLQKEEQSWKQQNALLHQQLVQIRCSMNSVVDVSRQNRQFTVTCVTDNFVYLKKQLCVNVADYIVDSSGGDFDDTIDMLFDISFRSIWRDILKETNGVKRREIAANMSVESQEKLQEELLKRFQSSFKSVDTSSDIIEEFLERSVEFCLDMAIPEPAVFLMEVDSGVVINPAIHKRLHGKGSTVKKMANPGLINGIGIVLNQADVTAE
jgi:hypothetical protein